MSGAKRQLEQQAREQREREARRAQSVGEMVASALRDRRQELDLTQGQLAYLAHISEGSVRNQETHSVAPRDKTWTSIQAVLGWAPGSLDLLQAGERPVEILPLDTLKSIIGDLIFGQDDAERMRFAADGFRTAISKADEHGKFTAEAAQELVNVVDSIGRDLLEPPEYEQVDEEDFIVVHDGGLSNHKELIDDLREALKVRLPVLSVGDRVAHGEFGIGTVVATSGSGRSAQATVDFDDHGSKTLLLQYAPVEKLRSGPASGTLPTLRGDISVHVGSGKMESLILGHEDQGASGNVRDARSHVRSVKASAASMGATSFAVGDRVEHEKFGLGTVAKLGAVKLRSGEIREGAKGAEVHFDDSGVKILDLRYAGLKHVEGSLRLPKELENTLRRMQIIDHLVSTPLTNDENLIVIAVLAKRDPDRSLGHRDVATFAGFADMKKRGVVAPNLEDIDTVTHDETEA